MSDSRMETAVHGPSPFIPEREQKVRECDCPAWVIRCVHFEDRIAVLVDQSADKSPPCPSHCLVLKDYAVGLLAGYTPCSERSGCQLLKGRMTAMPRFFESLSEANAAFERAEAELLASDSGQTTYEFLLVVAGAALIVAMTAMLVWTWL